MAKRFIDTELFNDDWFSELSKDGKLLFIYFITNCDHAGFYKLNKRLLLFQTNIDNLDETLKELSSCYIIVKENTFWIPKFIKFQYPGFPKSKVNQQNGALKLLFQNNLSDEVIINNLTLSISFEDLGRLRKSYGNGNGNGNGNVNDNVNVNDSNRYKKFKKEESSKIVEITKLFRNGNI